MQELQKEGAASAQENSRLQERVSTDHLGTSRCSVHCKVWWWDGLPHAELGILVNTYSGNLTKSLLQIASLESELAVVVRNSSPVESEKRGEEEHIYEEPPEVCVVYYKRMEVNFYPSCS